MGAGALAFYREYSKETQAEALSACKELRSGRLRLNGVLSSTIFSNGKNAGSGTAWAEIWTYFGELLVPIAYYLSRQPIDELTPDAYRKVQSDVFHFAGSSSRLIFDGLDGYLKNEGDTEALGRKILADVIKTVDRVRRESERTLETGCRIAVDGSPLTQAEVTSSKNALEVLRWRLLGRVGSVLGLAQTPDPGFEDMRFQGDDAKFLWAKGVLFDRLPVERIPAFMLAAKALALNLMPGSPLSATFDDDDPFSLLEGEGALPPSLAKKFTERSQFLLEYRDDVARKFNYDQTGILDPGTTELDRIAFEYIFNKHEKRSFLVLAPTSSGKSRLGQLALCQAVAARKSQGLFGNAIIIVPTKALVNQVAKELRDITGTEAEHWEILEGSRDYPQYDDRIRTSRFDIAVIIPEKLSSLLRIGMSLEECPVIVIDEMQHIVDGSRGQQLELLLMDLFQTYKYVRWVGLSASLSENTQRLLMQWFTANGVDIPPPITAIYRPVPLVVRAIDDNNRITNETHIPGKVLHSSATLTAQDKSIQNIADADLRRTGVLFKRTVSLVVELLEDHVEDGRLDVSSVPSILVFVSGRKLAENLTDVLRLVLPDALGLGRLDEEAVPYIGGRFARLKQHPDHRSPEMMSEELQMLPPGRLRTAVSQAVTSGIGFHSATLDATAREIVEEAFRQGFVRLLVATDTLKLGVNLPSDIVINADLVLNAANNRKALLDKDGVIQRLGRAGRLGLTTGRGIGYLVTPETFPPTQRSAPYFDVSVEARVGLAGSREATDKAVFSAVTKLPKVFDYYLSHWSGGAEYIPPSNDSWLHRVLLHTMVKERDLSIDALELEAQAMGVHSKSFVGLTGTASPKDTLPRLQQAGAIEIGEDNIARITDRGRAVGMNALEIEDVQVIADVASAAQKGAGPLTLLYIACLSKKGRGFTFQMQCHQKASLDTRHAVLELARKSRNLVRSKNPRYLRSFETDVEDVFGRGREADGLRTLLSGDIPTSSISPDQLTALWRATVLLRWWGCAPFRTLESAVEGKDSRVDETDLKSLAEGVSYMLGAASDLLGVSAEDMTFRSLQLFSQEIEIGLPLALSVLVRMNHRAMKRERILGLVPYLEDPEVKWDSLQELLRSFLTTSAGMPKRASSEWKSLDEEILDEVDEYLRESDEIRAKFAYALPAKWVSHRMPAGSSTSLDDHLKQIAAGYGALVIEKLLTCFDVQVNRRGNELTVTFPAGHGGAATSTVLVVPEETVSHEFIDRVLKKITSDQNVMIMATQGVTHGVLHRSKVLSDRCAVVDPSLFLEMLARVHERNLLTVEDEFEIDAADFDLETATQDLERMFINNAPVLSRSDLENRLVFHAVVKTVGLDPYLADELQGDVV
jgi:superfamily II DNA/RNA helicase